MNLESRIGKLERNNRWLLAALVAVLLVAAGAAAASSAKPLAHLAVERLDVVDAKGDSLLSIGPGADGGLLVQSHGAAGGLSIGLNPQQATLLISHGGRWSSLSATAATAELNVSSPKYQTLLRAGEAADLFLTANKPFDKLPDTGAAIHVDPRVETVSLNDGHASAALVSSQQQPGLVLYDRAGKRRAHLGIVRGAVGDEPALLLVDPAGNVVAGPR